MLRILGSKKVFCDGLTRRDLLHVGALAPLGLSLTGWSAAKATGDHSKKDGFGQAKRCVLLYLWGSPSQLDTFDPKPDAPEEIRGTLRSIATSMPGVRVGEILPRIAKLLDRTTVVRSLTHNKGVSLSSSVKKIRLNAPKTAPIVPAGPGNWRRFSANKPIKVSKTQTSGSLPILLVRCCS